MGASVQPECASPRDALLSGIPLSETASRQFADDLSVVYAAMSRRTNVAPRRLVAPGPSAPELELLLSMAVSAPDHGRIMPWRFVLVPSEMRGQLGDVFASALIQRDPSATADQISAARAKASHSPLLMLAVARERTAGEGVCTAERLVSLGAAIQCLLLGATAMGFGSGLVSGQAMDAAPLRQFFGLQPGEVAICFVAMGTVLAAKKSKYVRPPTQAIFSVLSSLAMPVSS